MQNVPRQNFTDFARIVVDDARPMEALRSREDTSVVAAGVHAPLVKPRVRVDAPLRPAGHRR
jgi:hypothetical protein